ncbi:MAG: hypothetical protein ACP5IO_04490 [Elusimicrobiales bacterium]
MKKLMILFTFFISSCTMIKLKNSEPYDTRFKLYYYTTDLENEAVVCALTIESFLSLFSIDSLGISEFKDKCRLYIEVSDKKKIGNKTRYRLYVDVKGIVDELKEKGSLRYNNISFAVNSDYERISELIENMNLQKIGFIFLGYDKKDITDYLLDIKVSSSSINTSVVNIKGVEITADIIRGGSIVDSVKAVGYSSDSDPLVSAARELATKLDVLKDKLKLNLTTVEFSGIKDLSDLKRISDFLKKISASYWVVSVSKSSLVLKIPIKVSSEEFSSQIVANMKNCVIENIDVENRFIKVIMNEAIVGII